MLSRRQLLEWLGKGLLGLGAVPVLQNLERVAAAATPDRPRFYLQIIPGGGMDAVWSIDPKRTQDVQRGIDVPYAAGKILTAHGIQLAPPMAPLERWVPKLAVVNAFRQNSANHVSGLVHTTCFRTTATQGTPSLLEMLGARRESQAAGTINIGANFASVLSPRYFGEPSTMAGYGKGLLNRLDALDPEDLHAIARSCEREARSIAHTSPSTDTTGRNLREAATFLGKWADAPKFDAKPWPFVIEGDGETPLNVQRALWMFEHGLVRCATVTVGIQLFDTHLWNFQQPDFIGALAKILDRLFETLQSTIVDGRPLSEQTAVIVGSEIGRFPRLNRAHGKDHFPQASYLFYGPWFRTGASYGATDRDMVARPVDLRTGTADTSGHRLALDDIGTTLLRLDGANPEPLGYTGEHLSFLVS